MNYGNSIGVEFCLNYSQFKIIYSTRVRAETQE